MVSSSLLVSERERVRAAQDDSLYEIINGQRVDLLPMGAYATWLASRLHSRLSPYTEDKGLGTTVTEMLFVLDAERDLRRRPDVAFVSTNRWPLDRELPRTGDWVVVPDLAVEVISPTDVFKDVLAKLREYFQYGVQVVWVIAPEEQQVYVYDEPAHVRILTVQDEVIGDEVVSGFRLPLAQLFQHSAVSTETPAS
ncbi:MAG: Uma2 family endonuclease [Candidatus Tectomicrobia bacterium]|nr:Uma2 family endonuclease [Candidatus Tectomicrobia bacterium]